MTATAKAKIKNTMQKCHHYLTHHIGTSCWSRAVPTWYQTRNKLHREKSRGGREKQRTQILGTYQWWGSHRLSSCLHRLYLNLNLKPERALRVYYWAKGEIYRWNFWLCCLYLESFRKNRIRCNINIKFNFLTEKSAISSISDSFPPILSFIWFDLRTSPRFFLFHFPSFSPLPGFAFATFRFLFSSAHVPFFDLLPLISPFQAY